MSSYLLVSGKIPPEVTPDVDCVVLGQVLLNDPHLLPSKCRRGGVDVEAESLCSEVLVLVVDQS